jgi:hypothetical protein
MKIEIDNPNLQSYYLNSLNKVRDFSKSSQLTKKIKVTSSDSYISEKILK